MDAAELERIELCHAKYFILLDKKRFLAPITATPHTVLDLGCGTGMCPRPPTWDVSGR